MPDPADKLSTWSNACVAVGVIGTGILVANLLDAVPVQAAWASEVASVLCVWRTLVWAHRLRRLTPATTWIAPLSTKPPTEPVECRGMVQPGRPAARAARTRLERWEATHHNRR